MNLSTMCQMVIGSTTLEQQKATRSGHTITTSQRHVQGPCKERDPHNPNASDTYRQLSNNMITTPGSTIPISTNNQSSNSSFVTLSTLTEVEKTYSSSLYATRQSANGFHSEEGYCNLTKAMVDAAKDYSINSDIHDVPVEMGRRRVRTSTNISTMMVALVVSHISTVLGESSESNDNKYIAPLYTPLIFGDCLIGGPCFASSIKIHALIDSSSYLVIIDSSLVDKLAMCCSRLPMLKLMLKDWVKITSL